MKGDPGEPGARGEQGDKGDPGELPIVRAWQPDEISYHGDVVCCDGSTYQARKDTAQKPPHSDWACLAEKGRDAAFPTVKGTHRDGEDYALLDIVALNGSSFIARRDHPGPCPGDGWQLIASAGRPGKPGIRGEQGERGERGPSGPTIIGWKVDRASYMATPIMSDNGDAEPLNLRPLFEQFDNEAR
ncbi:hypothetical protein [Bradyrhizobium sp. Leo170]|uniref:hypothetical protein n=1 Tax=Bradyrhizobium sp. Leo170 TaxID=1571199 RepID=UPI00102E3D49|nr:hypothetical protein [Bradyrhizobium sp. Leo170]TAI60832.1 hypothetical protein CWO89_38560 [Bradyrhizobium sp. Leo170]